MSAPKPTRCDNCEDRGWFWTTPYGFNPFRAGGFRTATAMYRMPCSCPAARAAMKETQP